MSANREKTGRFPKGVSGNPSGRPKRSETERAMLEAICSLAPKAVRVLEEILQDNSAPAAIRVKCASIVLERVCGTPMSIERIEQNEETFHIEWGCFS